MITKIEPGLWIDLSKIDLVITHPKRTCFRLSTADQIFELTEAQGKSLEKALEWYTMGEFK
jgi:predicted membrane GTPase involved in stress response